MSAMADSHPLSNVPGTPRFEREREDNSDPGPRGACNAIQGKCGCQQYFNEKYGRSGDGHPLYCVCTHHVCFHALAAPKERPSNSYHSQSRNVPQVGNGSVQRWQNESSSDRPEPDPFFGHKNASNAQIASQGSRRGLDLAAGPGSSRYQHSLPDTLPWNSSTQPSERGVLPPIPAQCLLPSQERIDRENQHFREGTQTSTSLSEGRAFADIRASSFLPIQSKVPQTSDQAIHTQRSNRNLTAVFCDNQDKQPTRSEKDNENLLEDEDDGRISSPIRSMRQEVVNLSMLVKAHGERIDSMERVSSAPTDNSDVHATLQARQEELEERFETAEIRQGELDERVGELEKARTDSNRGSVLRSSADKESATGDSFAYSNQASTGASLLFLKTQISDLQARQPTFEHPWEVEAVFLPFGSLKGIWSTKEAFPSQREGLPNQASRSYSVDIPAWIETQQSLSLEVKPGSWEAIVAKQHQRNVHEHLGEQLEHGYDELAEQHQDDGSDELLVARSCNRNSKIYERLKSRGLVKMIQIKGPSFKDVDATLLDSFGDVTKSLSKERDESTVQKRGNCLETTYHALQSSWIPLRKIRKSSKLRFLDAQELITPSIWNAEFLRSSVVWQATKYPVLFVTQPQSYTQHLTTPEVHNWTWPEIRLMPRVYSVETDIKDTDVDANEPCWEFDEMFDISESVQSSFQSLSIRPPPYEAIHSPASCSDHFSSAAAGTPTSSDAPIPESRSVLRRTASVPMRIPLQEITPLAKRKTSYHPDEHSKSSSQHASSSHLYQKRRRISRSPSGACNTPTPRPPTRTRGRGEETGTSEFQMAQRATTPPQPYATPHSNDYRAYSDDEDDGGSTQDDATIDVPMQKYESSLFLDDRPWEGIEGGSHDNDCDDDNEKGSVAESDSDQAPSEYDSTQPGVWGPRMM